MNQTRALWLNALLAGVNLALLAILLVGQFNVGHTQVAEQYFADNTVRIANRRFSDIAGAATGQGAITLFDKVTDKGFVGLGFYSHGAGIFTPSFFEVWSKGVSVASQNTTPNFQVRNKEDTRAAIWINGEGVIGAQDGPVTFAISRPDQEQWDTVGAFNKDGTFSVTGDIQMQGHSLAARLDAIEAKLGLKKQ